MHHGDRIVRMSRRSLLGGAAILTLSACGRGRDRDAAPDDFSALEVAVLAACPRVVQFGEPTAKAMNGFRHSISMAPDLDSTTPLSADELDAMVKAIWENTPFEPNAIRLVSRDAATGKVPIDLATAAKELYGLGSSPAGEGGVALTDMKDRYGAWRTG